MPPQKQKRQKFRTLLLMQSGLNAQEKPCRGSYVQRKLFEFMSQPTFSFELPEITPKAWKGVCNSNSESERLEFVGDAIIAAMVSEEMYRIFPYGDPSLYSCIKSVALSNATFAYLMCKLGFSTQAELLKPAADAFEVIMAAYHNESGAPALRAWVRQNFNPVIEATGRAAQAYRALGKSDQFDSFSERPSRLTTSMHPWSSNDSVTSAPLNSRGRDVYNIEYLSRYPLISTEGREIGTVNKVDGSALVTSRTVLRPALAVLPVIPTAPLPQSTGLGSAMDPIVLD